MAIVIGKCFQSWRILRIKGQGLGGNYYQTTAVPSSFSISQLWRIFESSSERSFILVSKLFVFIYFVYFRLSILKKSKLNTFERHSEVSWMLRFSRKNFFECFLVINKNWNYIHTLSCIRHTHLACERQLVATYLRLPLIGLMVK